MLSLQYIYHLFNLKLFFFFYQFSKAFNICGHNTLHEGLNNMLINQFLNRRS